MHENNSNINNSIARMAVSAGAVEADKLATVLAAEGAIGVVAVVAGKDGVVEEGTAGAEGVAVGEVRVEASGNGKEMRWRLSSHELIAATRLRQSSSEASAWLGAR